MSTLRKINLNYIDQVTYLEGFHRSGWVFVLRSLFTLHSDSGVWCDTYVDRTFLWASPGENIVPYTRPWIGFVHHTFNTTFSDYNNENLLKNEAFLASLPSCKGLVVFSQEQRDKWLLRLHQMGFEIAVESYVHPTEFVSNEQKFTMEKFLSNTEKVVIQIGAWLRDNYAIYRLNNGVKTFSLENGMAVHKAALVGPKMEYYYKPVDFFRYFKRTEWKHPQLIPPITDFSISYGGDTSVSADNDLSVNAALPADVLEQYGQVTGDVCRDVICRDIICRDSDYALNKYVLGAVELLKAFDASVIMFPTLSDVDYDVLLSRNIVFVKLVDAAAINTLQECLVRNTPIIINPLPAVVDVLGSEYPLYFEDIAQVPELVTLENIGAAYSYLVNMNKTLLNIDTFMTQFTTGGIYSSL